MNDFRDPRETPSSPYPPGTQEAQGSEPSQWGSPCGQPGPYGPPQYGRPPDPRAPQGWPPGPPQQEPQPRKRSRFLGLWIALGAVGAMVFLIVVGVLGFLFYIGVKGPATHVVTGTQLKRSYLEEIRSLGLLESDEAIRYFYSDALINITDGFYFLTDRKVVVYSTAFDDPAIVVPFGDIVEVDADFVDSVLEDSTIYLLLTTGEEVWFPVSSENKGDRKFFEAIQNSLKPDDSNSQQMSKQNLFSDYRTNALGIQVSALIRISQEG